MKLRDPTEDAVSGAEFAGEEEVGGVFLRRTHFKRRAGEILNLAND